MEAPSGLGGDKNPKATEKLVNNDSCSVDAASLYSDVENVSQ